MVEKSQTHGETVPPHFLTYTAFGVATIILIVVTVIYQLETKKRHTEWEQVLKIGLLEVPNKIGIKPIINEPGDRSVGKKFKESVLPSCAWICFCVVLKDFISSDVRACT